MIFRDWIILATGCVVLAGMLLVLTRAFLGPSVYDRILAMNAMGTKTVLLVAVLAFLARRSDFLDIAVAYALINFIATISILKYVEFRKLG